MSLSVEALLDQLGRCAEAHHGGKLDAESFANTMSAAYWLTDHWHAHAAELRAWVNSLKLEEEKK